MKENENLQVIEEKDDIITSLVLNGDMSKMTDEMKTVYYNRFCHSLGLNPFTQPFQILKMNGKQMLYATKDCTEQLRKIHKVSIIDSITQIENGLIITRVKVQDKDGRYDMSTGSVVLPNTPADKANAIMKAETKAKRRATLSICGLGILEETELDTIPEYQKLDLKGVIIEEKKPEPKETKVEAPVSVFQTQLRDHIRSLLGGKMSVKQALDKLNELLPDEHFESFPLEENVCQIILNKILMNSNVNDNGKNGNGK